MGYDLSCDWKAGFAPDPAKKQRVGYLVWFNGLDMGEFLKQDLDLYTPFAGATTYRGVDVDSTTGKVTCVGVLDRFSWTGDGGWDPLCISAYISEENAITLRAKLRTSLTTTKVAKLAWWICNYDEENKVWYEESYPKSAASVAGKLNAPGGNVRMMVAPASTHVSSGIDVQVCNVYFEVVPAAYDVFGLRFATSAETDVVRNWGHRDPRQDPRLMQT